MNWSPVARKMSSPWGFVPVLVLGVLGISGLWFFNNYERKEFEINQGVSPAARKNPLLAAQRYLQATGQPAESLEGMDLFANLPPPGDAIVIRHLPGGLSAPINDNLFSWVESGGHLLVVPNRLDSDKPENGNILEQLGVRFKERPKDSNCGCPSKTDEDNAAESAGVSEGDPEETAEKAADAVGEDMGEENGDSEEAAIQESEEDFRYRPYDSVIDLNVDDFPVQVEVFHSTLLEDKGPPASYRINGTYHIEYQNEENQARDDNFEEKKEEGAWLLQYALGMGKITVLSEMNLFYNAQIGNYDHAFFLSWLLKDAERVWLLYASNVDSLLTILWEKVPRFWISFFILLLLTLWKLQKQEGQLLQPEHANRYNIIAHFEASGVYNWRANKLATMIEANRRNVLQGLSGRFFGLRADQVERMVDTDSLSARTGISEKIFNEAFRQQIGNEQDLIRTTRALHRIQKLAQGGESTKNDS